MNPQSPENPSRVETLSGAKKILNQVLVSISTLNSDIEARMVNGTQRNTTADWHDAWSNLAPTIIMPLQLMAMMDRGELDEEDKGFFSAKAEELLSTIRAVDKDNRAAEEPKLQKIVDEIKAKAEEVFAK